MEALAVIPAVSLAKALLETLLGWADTAVADKLALVGRVRSDVQSIHDELRMMHAFLRSGGGVDGGDVHTEWVQQLRDLAFDIEDGLLDLMLIKAPAGLAARVRNADPVADLKARVDALHLRNQRYHAYVAADRGIGIARHDHQHGGGGDDDDPAAAALLDEWRRQDQGAVGRDGDKRALARMLCRNGKTVVAVWGKAGVGKSSLARKLYGDADLVDRFDRRAWVTLQHPLESGEAFSRLLQEQLGGVDDLGEEKRCLVVVDDVSSRDDWELISPCLAADCAGTRVVVLVTTRGRDVALQCASGAEEDVYELKPLALREAQKLLYHKVCKSSKYKLPYAIVKSISEQCRGCPLAIATIGGLLADMPKESIEWTNLQEHLRHGLESDDLDVRRVISLSYDGLPYHVKFCLLYMSIFPENCEIRHTRLLRRWMAEVYIEKKPGNMTLEEVARSHHSKLIKRRMIEPSNKARASMTSKCCSVHGLVLRLILPKSIEENQLFIVDKQCNEVPQSNVRHLVVTRWKGHEKMPSKNLTRLRSLTVFGECPVSLITHTMRFLRILDLEDTIGLKNEDLKEIGKLPHLRYLGLRGTNISKLPSSLQNLRFLETLDVKDTKVTEFPDGIIKLDNLCYLRVGVNFATEKMASRKDSNKHNKVRGSGSADRIIVKTPKKIEKLSNLQVLGVMHIASRQDARGLGKLNNLRKLGVDLTAAREGARRELCSSIARLDKLERLEVRCESLEFLRDMKEPVLRCLQSIRLCGHLGSLPGWMSSLNNLSKIKLLRTQLTQEDMVVIGSLRNVTYLGLWEESFADSLCFDKGAFLKLRLLDIDGLEVKTISIQNGALPALEKLQVRKCLELEDSEKGVSSVRTLQNLKEVELTNCGHKLGLEKALREQISGFPNRPMLITGKYVVTWIEMVLNTLYRLVGWE